MRVKHTEEFYYIFVVEIPNNRKGVKIIKRFFNIVNIANHQGLFRLHYV